MISAYHYMRYDTTDHPYDNRRMLLHAYLAWVRSTHLIPARNSKSTRPEIRLSLGDVKVANCFWNF